MLLILSSLATPMKEGGVFFRGFLGQAKRQVDLHPRLIHQSANAETSMGVNERAVYVIELKYIAKGDDSEALRKTKMDEAETQLAKYMADDELKTAFPNVAWHAVVVVFAGEDMIVGKMKK